MASPLSFENIRKEIKERNFAPIYLLMGNESYFIDQITQFLADMVLSETEKDFNLTVFYGADATANEIVTSSRRYPMMADKQLVILKEAQMLENFEILDSYFKKPLKSTVLVICYKHGTVDRRKTIVKNIERNGGVIFESKKLYDNKIPDFIKSYFTTKKINIEPKAAQMIADFVGTDLTKVIQELQKLEIIISKETKLITSEIVEKNIGISKEFNNYELKTAVAEKNFVVANRIVNYFEKNPKENPAIVTIISLFGYFSELLECFWLPQKNEQTVVTALKLRSGFFARDYMIGLRNYSAYKVIEIISLLRIYDAKLKGMDSASVPHGELLRELIFKIMH